MTTKCECGIDLGLDEIYFVAGVDHAVLENRDLPDQHSIESIKGLREELDQLKKDNEGIDDDDVATDEEVDNVVDDIFGPGDEGAGDDTSGGDTSGDITGGDDTTGEDDDDVATDEEVNDVLDSIFGQQ